MDDLTAVSRRAVLDAYEAGCRDAGIRPDKWITGALFAWAVNDRETEPPMHRLPAASAWPEHEARSRVTEATHEVARVRGVTLPDEVIVQMLAWIHDVKGWNA